VADLEPAIDSLYARPLVEFTPARDALSAELKKKGARDEAARIKTLVKPGVTSWAVNQLHHHEKERLAAFFELVARLREAQRTGSAEAFRAAQAARKEALSGLVKEAEKRVREAGHAPSPAALQKIEKTLDALSATGWPEGGAGRLVEDLEPPGFDAFAGVRVEAAPTPPPGAPPKPEAAKPSDLVLAAQAKRDAQKAAEAAVDEAQDALRTAKKTAAQAAAVADRARSEQAQIQDELQKVSLRAREATERAERASFEARRAGTAQAEAERALEAARVALDRARRAV
jgi:hypothetical protein